MTELIQYVDESGKLTGQTAEKLAAHHAHTRRHLAFSFYGFDADGRFLATQRAHTKKVWPDVWTNTCCGHPAPGEAALAAIQRRLDYELGIASVTDVECLLPDYMYTTPPYNGIIENEFCPVYIGRIPTGFTPNPAEVGSYTWMSWQDFVTDLTQQPDKYSYWTIDQTRQIQDAVVAWLAK